MTAVPRTRGVRLAGLAASVVVVTTGCSTQSQPRSEPSTHPDQFVAAGPWAAAFAETAATTSRYQRKILADGVITEQELHEAQSRATACMADSGYRYSTADDGSSEAAPLPGRPALDTDSVNTMKVRCSGGFDRDVTYLFNEVRRNPEKRSEAELVVRCLRAAGLVPGAYSERQWRSEYDSGDFSFSEWDPAAVQCRLDPLGLWRTP